MPNSARYSLFKMISQVSDERIIQKFPGPFKVDCSPYSNFDFSPIVYEKCAEQNNILSSLLNICKIIIIGDVSVGKTCIVNRFCRKIFDNNYKSTIGVDFEVERYEILNVGYNLQIWDTAGQERFKCIAQSYYRGAHVIIVVFDYSNLDSLKHCKNWLNEALNASNNSTIPFVFLVGTKKDLLGKFAFKNAELNVVRAAKILNAEYWAVSSKTGQNIDRLFSRIAALTFDKSIRCGADETWKTPQIGSDLISFKKNVRGRKMDEKCDQFHC